MRETFSTLLVAAVLLSVSAFSVSRMSSRIVRSRNMGLHMADYESQVLAAQPTIEEWLDVADPGLRRATLAMFRSVKEIAYKIRTASCDKMSCFNDFGDEQLAIDILANTVMFSNLQKCGSVATASSGETPIEDSMGGTGYSVAFDPLDGSSVIDTNFAVGSIWGIWPGDRLTGVKGRDMKCAGAALYGPRTTITIALDNMDYAHEFLLVDDMSAMHGEWQKSNEYTTISEGKLISPGNLKAIKDNEGYANLFNFWMDNSYPLRYTGGFVADVNQIMVKGKGIFVNAASPKSKSKLKMLYEVAPLAYLIEKAGGRSSNGEVSPLDVLITCTDQTSQVAYGSKKEVDRFVETVGVKYLPQLEDV